MERQRRREEDLAPQDVVGRVDHEPRSRHQVLGDRGARVVADVAVQ